MPNCSASAATGYASWEGGDDRPAARHHANRDVFLEAAAEARAKSRRYWAANDKRLPLQRPEYWPVMPVGFDTITRGRSAHAEKVAGKLLRAV